MKHCLGLYMYYDSSFISMDDELARKGIKQELTTTDDEYLDLRFKRLSDSGHNLTPMTADEIQQYTSDKSGDFCYDITDAGSFTADRCKYIGEGRKGVYAHRIGGLPLFASGYRVDEECSHDLLVFEHPCDASHIEELSSREGVDVIYIDDNSCQWLRRSIRCVRSGLIVGDMLESLSVSPIRKRYRVPSCHVRFLSIDSIWPVDSQPENFWGTEGQYRAWNRHDMRDKPLSY